MEICFLQLLGAQWGGPRKEDRVAIIVTSHEMEKLIAILKVGKGTGEEVAKAASASLLEWGISDKIVAMSFDTTAANTGRKNGACALLQQKLGEDFLCLGCHHHIHEVVCGDVFKALFGKSSGPNVELFRRFQQHWPKIYKSAYKPWSDSRLTSDLLSLKCEAVTFSELR